MKTYKILVDDFRQPEDLYYITRNEIFLEQSWLVVRSYEEFTTYIAEYYRRGAFPRFISFDYDLGTLQFVRIEQKQEVFVEKNGGHCAQWLAEFVAKNKVALPEIYIHSTNEAGKADILDRLAKVMKEKK